MSAADHRDPQMRHDSIRARSPGLSELCLMGVSAHACTGLFLGSSPGVAEIDDTWVGKRTSVILNACLPPPRRSPWVSHVTAVAAS
jgi:hypothetical protein